MNRSLTVLVGLLCVSSLGAQDSEDQATPKGILPVPDYDSEDGQYLSKNWGGSRSPLADDGLQVTAVFTQVGQGVVDGGRDTGWRYGGRLDTLWSFDLDRLGLLPGALVTMTTQSRYGESVNTQAGVVLPVNDVMYFPLTDPADEDLALAITELRYTQFLSKDLGFFLGKFIPLGGDFNEFAAGRGDTQFLSHPFLTPSVTSLINPYSTLGGGVFGNASETVSLSSSIYSSADSSTTSGFDDLGNGWVWSTSLRKQYELHGKPGGMMITGQYGFDNDFVNFDGQFIDGGEFTIPVTGDTWNAFWNGWQYLHVDEGSEELVQVANGRTDRRGFGVFGRVAAADRSTNPVAWVFSGGLGGRGVGGRNFDSYGLGYAYSTLGNEELVQASSSLHNGSRAEVYYTLGILRGAELTFNVQYADSILQDIDPATVLGLRLRLEF